jgi:hypothetical protein
VTHSSVDGVYGQLTSDPQSILLQVSPPHIIFCSSLRATASGLSFWCSSRLVTWGGWTTCQQARQVHAQQACQVRARCIMEPSNTIKERQSY